MCIGCYCIISFGRVIGDLVFGGSGGGGGGIGVLK